MSCIYPIHKSVYVQLQFPLKHLRNNGNDNGECSNNAQCSNPTNRVIIPHFSVYLTSSFISTPLHVVRAGGKSYVILAKKAPPEQTKTNASVCELPCTLNCINAELYVAFLSQFYCRVDFDISVVSFSRLSLLFQLKNHTRTL